ncbi:MAG: hypothetical protein E7431_07045 [Ruminococcaceae bacterium]|nr:hypothetical protein [Oscillospiraceae bacterium]
MKRIIALLLCVLMILPVVAGCFTPAPVIAAIGESFITEYATWNMVNAGFTAEAIETTVASGGSGDGPKSVLDGTADFGMLARAVKDSEKGPAISSTWWLPMPRPLPSIRTAIFPHIKFF